MEFGCLRGFAYLCMVLERFVSMRKFVAFLMFATGLCGMAQLSTEVVVDRNIAPEERTAERPNWLTPVIVLDESTPEPLETSVYTALSPLTRGYSVLPAASGLFAAEKTPYRGYVAGGYFPTLDFGVSAGYRVIDKKKMVLGARLHFDSERYRPYGEEGSMGAQYFATVTAGVDFSWKPLEKSVLTAFGDYTYLRDKTTYWYPQNVNSGRLGAGWKSTAGIVGYSAKINVGFEKASDTYKYLVGLDESPLLPGLSQQQVEFNAKASVPVGQTTVGLDVTGDYVMTSGEFNRTEGFTDITPYFTYSTKKFGLKIGVKFDFARSKFSVMPDVRLNVTPVKGLGVWVTAGGGSETNSFARMRRECVYQIFDYGFGASRVPIVIDGGVNFGPFKGLYFGVFGGYAVADGWLMTTGSVYQPFVPLDVKGWHAGAKAGIKWKFVKAELKADFAPSGHDKAWWTRRDRSGTVIDFSVEARPLQPLTVGVDYEFRNRRKAFYTPEKYLDMGCVSNLSIGAEWRFTEAFSVFGRVENVLGRRFMLIAWEPSRKVSGLFGATYKF